MKAAKAKAEQEGRRRGLVAIGRAVAGQITDFAIKAGSMMAHDREWKDKVAFLVTDQEREALIEYLFSLTCKPADTNRTPEKMTFMGIEVRNR